MLIGISKSWENGTARTHPRAKKYLYGYYYDSNGKFYTKRLSQTQALLLKRKIVKIKKLYCETCGLIVMCDKRNKNPHCPRCNK